MDYGERIELFEKIRAEYSVFLLSVLWKLTGDRELFTEAVQYALLGIWQHLGKLNSKKAAAYIYRIALTANSKAWRNRIGRDGQLSHNQAGLDGIADQKFDRAELTAKIRQAIAQLPTKQAKAIVMRYLEQQDYQVVAQKLSCSEASARSHVSKALAALKTKLAASVKQE